MDLGAVELNMSENHFHLVLSDCVGGISVYKIHNRHKEQFISIKDAPNEIDLLLNYTSNIERELLDLKKDIYVFGFVMFVKG